MINTNFELLHKAAMTHTDLTQEEIIKLRQVLSKLRAEIKERVPKEDLQELVEDHPEVLRALLVSNDAKIRKNTALLCGDLEMQECLDELYDCYEKEETLFVKSAYLQAMQNMDCTAYLSRLQGKMTQLSEIVLTDENRKHVTEEMRELSALLQTMEKTKHHKFTGNHVLSDVVLLTHRNFIDITMEELELIPMVDRSQIRKMSAGLRIRENFLEDILQIRTWQELLFLVKDMTCAEMNADKVAEKILKADLVGFLEKRHQGLAPFSFRIEIKSKMPLDKKSDFAKKLGVLLEQGTGRKLINAPSDYEVELRLIENKDHNFNIMVKLLTINDNRFAYREEVLPTSIKPVNAALLVAIASEYMEDDARVLDPFCGVATMLIERQKIVKANTSYGIDILEEAIRKARKNTDAAGQIIHFINKDFFHFSHEYQFDEIFTNMPFAMGMKTKEDIREIYDHFFCIADSFLKKNGQIIMYTHDYEFVEEFVRKYEYKIFKHWQIHVKEKTDLYIIR